MSVNLGLHPLLKALRFDDHIVEVMILESELAVSVDWALQFTNLQSLALEILDQSASHGTQALVLLFCIAAD
jgi:hypothetical protein